MTVVEKLRNTRNAIRALFVGGTPVVFLDFICSTLVSLTLMIARTSSSHLRPNIYGLYQSTHLLISRMAVDRGTSRWGDSMAAGSGVLAIVGASAGIGLGPHRHTAVSAADQARCVPSLLSCNRWN